jgi:hypothetical protein
MVDSGADSDITQDDMENMTSASASDISAEVIRFLDEEKLDDGPCKGLTFTVRTNILECFANLRRLLVRLTLRLSVDRKQCVNLNQHGDTEGKRRTNSTYEQLT